MEYYDSDVDPNDIMYMGEVEMESDDANSSHVESDSETSSSSRKIKHKNGSRNNKIKQSNEQVRTLKIKLQAPKTTKRRIEKDDREIIQRIKKEQEEKYIYKSDGFVVNDDDDKVLVPPKYKIPKAFIEKQREQVQKPKIQPIISQPKSVKKASVFDRLSKSLKKRK